MQGLLSMTNRFLYYYTSIRVLQQFLFLYFITKLVLNNRLCRYFFLQMSNKPQYFYKKKTNRLI